MRPTTAMISALRRVFVSFAVDGSLRVGDEFLGSIAFVAWHEEMHLFIHVDADGRGIRITADRDDLFLVVDVLASRP